MDEYHRRIGVHCGRHRRVGAEWGWVEFFRELEKEAPFSAAPQGREATATRSVAKGYARSRKDSTQPQSAQATAPLFFLQPTKCIQRS